VDKRLNSLQVSSSTRIAQLDEMAGNVPRKLRFAIRDCLPFDRVIVGEPCHPSSRGWHNEGPRIVAVGTFRSSGFIGLKSGFIARSRNLSWAVEFLMTILGPYSFSCYSEGNEQIAGDIVSVNIKCCSAQHMLAADNISPKLC